MRYLVLFACLAVLPLRAGELYRWVDSAGKVHYGDSIPRDVTQVEIMKFPDGVGPNEDLPYETRLARENFPVILYVGRDCGEYCLKARDFLSKRGIPFSEKKLVTQEEVDTFKVLSGADIAPTLAVGRTFLPGFDAARWHNELDIAGYPKTAPYRAPAKAESPTVVPAPVEPTATAAPEKPVGP